MSIKEENLIPVEGIIKAGQRLVKIGETFVPIGFGGNFEPGAISFKEEGRDTYYKCASVGETTWDGYALILGADGYYTISETLTTGLSYGIGYTPKVDGVYNANATISVGKYSSPILESDLYFYHPLSEALTVAPTGQAITTVGTPTYTEVQGIGCMTNNNGANYLKVDFPQMNAPFTVSLWANSTQSSGDRQLISANDNKNVFSWYGYGDYRHYKMKTEYQLQNNVGKWMHIVYSMNGTNSKIYVNGVDQETDFSNIEDFSVNFSASTWLINQNWTSSGGWACFGGYMANLRIYTREADIDLVNALYSELTPTA